MIEGIEVVLFRTGYSDRRHHISEQPRRLNGIDFVEVVIRSDRAAELWIFLINPIDEPPFSEREIDIVAPRGVSPVKVSSMQTGAEGVSPDELAALPEADRRRLVRANVDLPEGNAEYRLSIRSAPRSAGILMDPLLSTVAFRFPRGAERPFVTRGSTRSAQPEATPAVASYLARDFQSFRTLMLDRLRTVVEGFTDPAIVDVQQVVVDILAHEADRLSYFQDAVATEAYPGTARLRVSLRRHAKLLDCILHEGCNARAFVALLVTEEAGTVRIAAGTRFLTSPKGEWLGAIALPVDLDRYVSDGSLVFEAMHDLDADPRRNAWFFHDWGDPDAVIARGATSAHLKLPDGQAPSDVVRAGDVVLIDAWRELDVTGRLSPGDADPTRRHPVRVRAVERSHDPVYEQELLYLTWSDEEPLPFDLPIGTRAVRRHLGDAWSADQPAYVIRGNVVLVDHGLTCPATPGGGSLAARMTPEVVEAGIPFRPRLHHPFITHAEPLRLTERKTATARALLEQDPERAIAQVWLEAQGLERWAATHDLLDGGRDTRSFVAEVDDDGESQLRFGDNVHGLRPEPGQRFVPTYRVGGGTQGNVGADAIVSLLAPSAEIADRVWAVFNPLPASGGQRPMDKRTAREAAPQRYKQRKTAVTPADYAAVIESHPEVEQATGHVQWTGSFHTLVLTIERGGGRGLDELFRDELFRALEPRRIAGHELSLREPDRVPIALGLRLAVAREEWAEPVRDRVLERFVEETDARGARSFFGGRRFRFGDTLYASQVVAGVMEVPGVQSVRLTCFDYAATPAEERRVRDALCFGARGLPCLLDEPSGDLGGYLELTSEVMA